MIRFRSLEDVDRALLPPALRSLVRRHFEAVLGQLKEIGCEYDPDADGEVVLFESAAELLAPLAAFDIEEALPQLLLECAEYHPEARCWLAVYVRVDWGLSLFVPDFPDLDPGVRSFLERTAAECGGC